MLSSRVQVLNFGCVDANTVRLALVAIALFAQQIDCQSGEPIYTARDEVDESDLACASCLAVVDIIENHMAKKSFEGVETRLYELMDSICDQSNFQAYDFIPPKMVEGCRKFVEKVDEEKLVSVFEKVYSAAIRKDRNALERQMCLSLSGECIANKRIPEKKIDPKKEIDDKEFEANVDDLMKKHGHKLKQPNPVKHGDEL